MVRANGQSYVLNNFVNGSAAAQILKTSPQTIIHLARNGKLRHVRVGNNTGMRLYFLGDILQLAASRSKIRRRTSR